MTDAGRGTAISEVASETLRQHDGETAVDLGSILGDYAVTPLDFDEATLSASKRRLLDTIGCALAAHDEDAVVKARAYASRHGSGGKARIWGSGDRTSMEAAVFVNTAAVRILDYNDAYLGQENLHPSDVIPALLTVADESDCSGREFLEAIMVAYEVGITLCDAFNLRDRGWDHIAITRFAGICGIGRLLELTSDQVAQALSISAVAHNATRQSRTGELSMWKGLATADAMKTAVYAAELARVGVEGPFAPFVGAHGFTNRILEGVEPDTSVLQPLQDLAPPRRASDSHLKLMPFAYAGHSTAEAAANLGREANVSPDNVESLLIETYDVAFRIMAQPESWKPTTRETADHSIPYVATYALFNGRVDVGAFEASQYERADYHDFMSEKVRVSATDELSACFPSELPSRVTLKTTAGAELVEETRVPYGHASRPPTNDDLLEKFHQNCRHVVPPLADTIADQVESLESATSISTLTDLLTDPRLARIE